MEKGETYLSRAVTKCCLLGFVLLKTFSQHPGMVSNRLGDAELHDSVMSAKERLQGQRQEVLVRSFNCCCNTGKLLTKCLLRTHGF